MSTPRSSVAAIFGALPGPALLIDEAGRLAEINSDACTLLAVARDEVIGALVGSICVPDSREMLDAALANTRRRVELPRPLVWTTAPPTAAVVSRIQRGHKDYHICTLRPAGEPEPAWSLAQSKSLDEFSTSSPPTPRTPSTTSRSILPALNDEAEGSEGSEGGEGGEGVLGISVSSGRLPLPGAPMAAPVGLSPLSVGWSSLSAGSPLPAGAGSSVSPAAGRPRVASEPQLYSGRQRFVPLPAGADRGGSGGSGERLTRAGPERYSASFASSALASAKASARGSPPGGRGGGAAAAKSRGGRTLSALLHLDAEDGFASAPDALRAATVVVVAMAPGMAAQRTMALLQQQGYQPILEHTGAAAVATLRAPTTPGGLRLLLADAVLPDMGSIALRRAMDAEQLDAPLAVMLPHARRAEAETLRKHGVAACILRPLNTAEVAALWQLPVQQLVLGYEAEGRELEEVEQQRRAFQALLQDYKWPDKSITIS